MPQPSPADGHMELLDALRSSSHDLQNQAFAGLTKATEQPVPWAYEVWDTLVQTLRDGDNRQRAIASQVLANLAKSDPEGRMLQALPALLQVTRDERFVTARHCLQSLWKVAVAGEAQREAVMTGLAARFAECAAEKNGTLIRYDILVAMRQVYDLVPDETIRTEANRLMAAEPDAKYRKKYATVWRK